MARKSKLRGFGLGDDAAGTAGQKFTPGYAGREESAGDIDTLFNFKSALVREPVLRVVNVGVIGAGIILHFLGAKHALTASLGISLFDIVARQVSGAYRIRMLKPWNTGVL